MKEVIGNGDLIQGVNIGTNIAKKIKENFYYIDDDISIINTIYSKKKLYDKNNNIKLLDKNLKNISDNYDKKSLKNTQVDFYNCRKKLNNYRTRIYTIERNISNNIRKMLHHNYIVPLIIPLKVQVD